LRFPFLELPGEPRIQRPVLPIVIERLAAAPQLCLVDTGALRNCLPADVAGAAGVPIGDAPVERVAVGGTVTTARVARVDLGLAGWTIDAPVWFCDPWPFPFGLLGQEGFLRYFHVELCAAEGWLDCRPEPHGDT
jgi:hypothetical protein